MDYYQFIWNLLLQPKLQSIEKEQKRTGNNSNRMSFKGKNAVVTGGASGIGLQVVKLLLQHGAGVCVQTYVTINFN